VLIDYDAMHDEFNKQLTVLDGLFIGFDELFAEVEEKIVGLDRFFVELMATCVEL
jgi:hypothetical protein